MKMEIKSIEQIKDELAKELKYKDWLVLRRCHLHKMNHFDSLCTQVAIKYAAQFQAPTDILTTEIMVLRERVEELESALDKVITDIDNTNIPYLDITSETLYLIESLVNKGQ